jgi:hypothetical protein
LEKLNECYKEKEVIKSTTENIKLGNGRLGDEIKNLRNEVLNSTVI